MNRINTHTIGGSPFKHTTGGKDPTHDELYKNNKEQHRAAHGVVVEDSTSQLLTTPEPLYVPGVDDIYDLYEKETEMQKKMEESVKLLKKKKKKEEVTQSDKGFYLDPDIREYRKPFTDYLPDPTKKHPVAKKLKIDGVSPFSHTGANRQNRTAGEIAFKTWLVDNAVEKYEYKDWWDVETSRLWNFYKERFLESEEFLKLDSTVKTPFVDDNYRDLAVQSNYRKDKTFPEDRTVRFDTEGESPEVLKSGAVDPFVLSETYGINVMEILNGDWEFEWDGKRGEYAAKKIRDVDPDDMSVYWAGTEGAPGVESGVYQDIAVSKIITTTDVVKETFEAKNPYAKYATGEPKDEEWKFFMDTTIDLEIKQEELDENVKHVEGNFDKWFFEQFYLSSAGASNEMMEGGVYGTNYLFDEVNKNFMMPEVLKFSALRGDIMEGVPGGQHVKFPKDWRDQELDDNLKVGSLDFYGVNVGEEGGFHDIYGWRNSVVRPDIPDWTKGGTRSYNSNTIGYEGSILGTRQLFNPINNININLKEGQRGSIIENAIKHLIQDEEITLSDIAVLQGFSRINGLDDLKAPKGNFNEIGEYVNEGLMTFKEFKNSDLYRKNTIVQKIKAKVIEDTNSIIRLSIYEKNAYDHVTKTITDRDGVTLSEDGNAYQDLRTYQNQRLLEKYSKLQVREMTELSNNQQYLADSDKHLLVYLEELAEITDYGEKLLAKYDETPEGEDPDEIERLLSTIEYINDPQHPPMVKRYFGDEIGPKYDTQEKIDAAEKEFDVAKTRLQEIYKDLDTEIMVINNARRGKIQKIKNLKNNYEAVKANVKARIPVIIELDEHINKNNLLLAHYRKDYHSWPGFISNLESKGAEFLASAESFAHYYIQTPLWNSLDEITGERPIGSDKWVIHPGSKLAHYNKGVHKDVQSWAEGIAEYRQKNFAPNTKFTDAFSSWGNFGDYIGDLISGNFWTMATLIVFKNPAVGSSIIGATSTGSHRVDMEQYNAMARQIPGADTYSEQQLHTAPVLMGLAEGMGAFFTGKILRGGYSRFTGSNTISSGLIKKSLSNDFKNRFFNSWNGTKNFIKTAHTGGKVELIQESLVGLNQNITFTLMGVDPKYDGLNIWTGLNSRGEQAGLNIPLLAADSYILGGLYSMPAYFNQAIRPWKTSKIESTKFNFSKQASNILKKLENTDLTPTIRTDLSNQYLEISNNVRGLDIINIDVAGRMNDLQNTKLLGISQDIMELKQKGNDALSDISAQTVTQIDVDAYKWLIEQESKDFEGNWSDAFIRRMKDDLATFDRSVGRNFGSLGVTKVQQNFDYENYEIPEISKAPLEVQKEIERIVNGIKDQIKALKDEADNIIEPVINEAGINFDDINQSVEDLRKEREEIDGKRVSISILNKNGIKNWISKREGEGEPKKEETDEEIEQKENINVENKVDQDIVIARNNDWKMQQSLEKYGIKWQKTPVVRFVAKSEVDALMDGKNIEGRFKKFGPDVTRDVEGDKVPAATLEYRVSFKEEGFDDKMSNSRIRMKNKQDGWVKGGYNINDVSKIETKNQDGQWETVYDSELSKGSALNTEIAKMADYASEQFGFIVNNKDGSTDIIINRETSLANGKMTTGFHEMGHEITYNTIQRNQATQDAIGDALIKFISEKPGYVSEEFIRTLEQYEGDANFGEEVLMSLSEAMVNKEVVFDEEVMNKTGDLLRRFYQSTGMLDITWDSAEDVFDFIKDYNDTVVKRHPRAKEIVLKIATQGVKGKLIKKPFGVGSDIQFAKNVKREQQKNPDLKYKFDQFVQNPDGTKKYQTKEEFRRSSDFIAAWETIANDPGRSLYGLIVADAGKVKLEELESFYKKVTENLALRFLGGKYVVLNKGGKTKKIPVGKWESKDFEEKRNQLLNDGWVAEEKILETGGFNPALNESLFGWLSGKNGAIKWAREDEFEAYAIKTKIKGPSIDRAKRDIGGETFASQIEAETDVEMKKLEEEVIVPGKKAPKPIKRDVGRVLENLSDVELENMGEIDATIMAEVEALIEQNPKDLEQQLTSLIEDEFRKLIVADMGEISQIKVGEEIVNGKKKPIHRVEISKEYKIFHALQYENMANSLSDQVIKKNYNQLFEIEQITREKDKKVNEITGEVTYPGKGIYTIKKVIKAKWTKFFTEGGYTTLKDRQKKIAILIAKSKAKDAVRNYIIDHSNDINKVVDATLKKAANNLDNQKNQRTSFDSVQYSKVIKAETFIEKIKRLVDKEFAEGIHADKGRAFEQVGIDRVNKWNIPGLKTTNKISTEKGGVADVTLDIVTLDKPYGVEYKYGITDVFLPAQNVKWSLEDGFMKGNKNTYEGVFDLKSYVNEKTNRNNITEYYEFSNELIKLYNNNKMPDQDGNLRGKRKKIPLWEKSGDVIPTFIHANHALVHGANLATKVRVNSTKENLDLFNLLTNTYGRKGNDTQAIEFFGEGAFSINPENNPFNLTILEGLAQAQIFINAGNTAKSDSKKYGLPVIKPTPRIMPKPTKITSQAKGSMLEEDYMRTTAPVKVAEVVNPNNKANLQFSKAVDKSRLTNRDTEAQGITVLDFDDTLATTKSKVLWTAPDGTTGSLNAEQYASTYQDLAAQGYKFDFSEFTKIVEGKTAPLFNKALKLQEKFGSSDMFILTARPPEAQQAIYEFLKSQGLDIPLKNITALGDSTSEAKALWMAEKVAEGYNDFYFADDALANVQAVKNMLDQFDIKSKVQQAKIQFSKDLDTEFNNILEETMGVESKKRFSDAQAKLRGKGKGRFKSIIAPSAQDFAGLLYNFIGKGKKGEKQFKILKKALIDPFARGINELNSARQNASNDYKGILKQFPRVKKDLNVKLKRFEGQSEKNQFTVDQAIRVYLWNKAGFEVPGLSKADLKNLTDFVKNDPEISAFADGLGLISKKKDGYTKPGEYWLVESIPSDLFSDGAIGDARSEFLAEWIQNKDIVFTKENLNKIEVIYGAKFREALEDMLYRMETGRSRPMGGGRLMNTYMNWVNNSVGAIMFFNIRSAVLQTISATNYVNWTDNNPLNAAGAFANQVQFWKDFSFIFNSDMLKQRRAGLRHGIHEAELAEAVAGSTNKAKAAIAWLLKKGFTPTQIADSFAISSGGATFYRNRVNSYKKQGMDQKAAEKRAWLDFQERTEVAQQSARPDLISQQQANPLGRLILAFANTPMQYMRIMNKAARDMANNRGDFKEHASKIIYYGAIQSIIFASLQAALFAALGDEDEEELDKKKTRIWNTMLDSWLVGIGYGGRAISTTKNTLNEYFKQKAKDEDESWGTRSNHTYTIIQALNFSPAIGSKIRKIYQSIQTEKFHKDVMLERGFTLDNPLWSAIGNVVEGVTNIPLGRIAQKMNNVDNAMDSNHEMWQRVALMMGWNTWDLGVKDPDIVALGESIKERKKQEKKIEKLKEKYPGKTTEEINVIKKEKEIFNLKKDEQVDILKDLGLSDQDIKNLKKEKDRVDKIMDMYDDNTNKIDDALKTSEVEKPKEKKKKKTKEVKVDKNKEFFNLKKDEQVRALKNLGLSDNEIKKLKKEQNRVDKMIELYNKDNNKVDKAIKKSKEYKPSASEKRSKELYSMTKKEQVDLLMEYGISGRAINTNALKYEEDRVKMLIKLESKKKK